jgi:hypothetical protein
VPVAASVADPQSATLSRLTALGEARIRDIIAILIAVLVEIGSALGFTFVLLASRSAAPPSAGQMAKRPEDTVSEPERRPVKPGIPMKLSETPADTVSRWAFSRLDVLRAGRIQAEVAYSDFVA